MSLLSAGLTADEIIAIGPEAKAKGKGFAWLLAAAEGRRRDAAVSDLPGKQEKPWFMTSTGIVAKGEELGITQHHGELFPTFKARVYAEAGVTDEMVRRERIDAGERA